MENPKLLISTGCSFTQYPNTRTNWPFYLTQRLSCDSYYAGTGCADNDFIANKTLYQLDKAILQNNIDPKTILLGVMWSGLGRKSVYLQNPYIDFYHIKHYEDQNQHWFCGNPNRIVDEANYYFINPQWKDQLSDLYYRYFYDEVGAAINTIKNMLLVQNFCKVNNIKYFFTEYAEDTIRTSADLENPDIKYLYDMLDLTNFLPISNMDYWNQHQSGYSFPVTDDGIFDNHPTNEMSEKFVDVVILPHLKSKGYVE